MCQIKGKNATQITVSVKINNIELSKNLNISVAKTKSQEVLFQISEHKHYYINGNTDNDLSDQDARNAIIQSIFITFPALAQEYTVDYFASPEVTSFNFVDSTQSLLNKGEFNQIKMSIKLGDDPRTIDLPITLNYPDPNNQAQVISYKITDLSIEIPWQSQLLTVSVLQKEIKNSIKASNPYLAEEELSKINFVNPDALIYPAPKMNEVQYIINVSQPFLFSNPQPLTQTFLVSVAENPANVIIHKIHKIAIELPKTVPTYIKDPDTIIALKKALQNSNPDLSSEDLEYMSFSVSDDILLPAQKNDVTIKVVIGEATATIHINVTIAESRVNTVTSKIVSTNITLPVGTDLTIEPDQNTGEVFMNLLQDYNPSLTQSDLGFISFDAFTLKITTFTRVVITVSADPANPNAEKREVILQVTVAKSAADFIKNKIINNNIKVYGNLVPEINNPITKQVILEELQTSNPALTKEEISMIVLSGGPLVFDTKITVIVEFDLHNSEDPFQLPIAVT